MKIASLLKSVRRDVGVPLVKKSTAPKKIIRLFKELLQFKERKTIGTGEQPWKSCEWRCNSQDYNICINDGIYDGDRICLVAKWWWCGVNMYLKLTKAASDDSRKLTKTAPNLPLLSCSSLSCCGAISTSCVLA